LSNAITSREQHDQLFGQTETQRNPGAAVPQDFHIQDRDGGQRGDSKAERAALLGKADRDIKSDLREPTPVRNEVPHKRWVNE
jgi:hypothetical protein